MSGYRSIWHTLRLGGLQVPRRVFAGVVRELDPKGCEIRNTKQLRRRKYSIPGTRSKLLLAHWQLWQTKTFRFSYSWLYWWMEQKDNVATIGILEQESQSSWQKFSSMYSWIWRLSSQSRKWLWHRKWCPCCNPMWVQRFNWCSCIWVFSS